jgi:hypothetical protein
MLVAVNDLRVSPQSTIPSGLFHLISAPGRRQEPGPVSGPTVQGGANLAPKEHSGGIVVSRLCV